MCIRKELTFVQNIEISFKNKQTKNSFKSIEAKIWLNFKLCEICVCVSISKFVFLDSILNSLNIYMTYQRQQLTTSVWRYTLSNNQSLKAKLFCENFEREKKLNRINLISMFDLWMRTTEKINIRTSKAHPQYIMK